MNADELKYPLDRKHAQRSEKRKRARTYTHKNTATINPGSTGYSVECPRCCAHNFYLMNDNEINCENCGELILL